MKNCTEVLIKLKVQQSFLGIYPKDKINPTIPLISVVLLTVAKIWKQPKCPLGDYVYTQNEILVLQKREIVL